MNTGGSAGTVLGSGPLILDLPFLCSQIMQKQGMHQSGKVDVVDKDSRWR